MNRLLLLLGSLVGVSAALVVSPLAAHASPRVLTSPSMACNGGKGGRGGMSPKKDKNRRGKLKRLLYAVRAPCLLASWARPAVRHSKLLDSPLPAMPYAAQADSPENVEAILLSSQTEKLVMDMNWKVRKFAKHHIKKRAAQFEVEVPADFAGFGSPKQNMPKHLLSASIKERSPSHPAAVAALAKLRAA